jgi:hypothetical protein
LTKAELIADLAADNPHLRQADVELIVTTISSTTSPPPWLAVIASSCASERSG